MSKYTWMCNKCNSYARPPGEKPPVFDTKDSLGMHFIDEHEYLYMELQDGEIRYDRT